MADDSIREKLGNVTIHRNLSMSELVERAVQLREGILASNGALMCLTGQYTGRSPNDKFLESDDEAADDHIWWGNINKSIPSKTFDLLKERALNYLSEKEEIYEFCGYSGADPEYRIKVQLFAEKVWHTLFANTLFIRPEPGDLDGFQTDWTIINACDMPLDDWKELGLNSSCGILQSLEKKIVVILGSQYGGEIKKSIFYAMNYDMTYKNVCPMHCSANVDRENPTNVALFFGLSGTGKTTLSADPDRALIGDDEHGWSDKGVFNFEGGCYAKCIKLSQENEPQIWNAIKFGSVLENVVLSDSRVPDYDDGSLTQNTRVTYPVDFIPNAQIPSVGGHPKNVVFLTADAFGVLPPVSRLTREQAAYYFINGYTSKLAGTERGVTEPQPSFSPCFGGPFLPRLPSVYAEMLAARCEEHNADIWLVNTGWSGGPAGVGSRMSLPYTRAMVTAILNGSLSKANFSTIPIFNLSIPDHVEGVPDKVLDPAKTWDDQAAYKEMALKLGQLFQENAGKFDLPEAIMKVGPQV